MKKAFNPITIFIVEKNNKNILFFKSPFLRTASLVLEVRINSTFILVVETNPIYLIRIR